jgi:hypothetical protein
MQTDKLTGKAHTNLPLEFKAQHDGHRFEPAKESQQKAYFTGQKVNMIYWRQ